MRWFICDRPMINLFSSLSEADKQMHEQRREEARELMKLIREKNDEVEPGRLVRLCHLFTV